MFSRKISGIILLIALAAGISITTTRCYDDDKDARVTIHLERNDLATMGIQPQKHFIDKVLEFFSTPAYAVIGWDGTHYDLTLTVTGPSFETKTFIIPVGTTQYSLILPSTNNVEFTAISYSTSELYNNWGGQKVIDLGPGDQNINIDMIPMTKISFDSSNTTSITLAWESTELSFVTGYSIYRSTIADGIYSQIAVVSGNSSISYTDNDPSLTGGGATYYYKICVNTTNGIGLFSNYTTGQLSF